MSTTVQEWGRICQLVVGRGGTGLEVTSKQSGYALRVHFEVIKTIAPTPNTATIQVYNLSPDNASQIEKDYVDILLNAGYTGNQALIFYGNIQFVSHYRKETDWITEITAG